MSDDIVEQRIRAWVGSGFLLLAAVFSVAVFVDRCTDLSLGLPSAFYQSRWLHLPLNVAFYMLGWFSLKGTSEEPMEILQQAPLFHSVVLYTRPGCTLCIQAKQLLNEYSLELPETTLINIAEDQELEAAYGNEIPVVVMDGRERFRGLVSRQLLERLLDAKRRQRMDSSPSDRRNTPI